MSNTFLSKTAPGGQRASHNQERLHSVPPASSLSCCPSVCNLIYPSCPTQQATPTSPSLVTSLVSHVPVGQEDHMFTIYFFTETLCITIFCCHLPGAASAPPIKSGTTKKNSTCTVYLQILCSGIRGLQPRSIVTQFDAPVDDMSNRGL